MKVCLLNHGLASGGTDSFVIALASGLISDGYDVTIALAVNPDSGQQFKEEQAIELGAQVRKLSDLGGGFQYYPVLVEAVSLSKKGAF